MRRTGFACAGELNDDSICFMQTFDERAKEMSRDIRIFFYEFGELVTGVSLDRGASHGDDGGGTGLFESYNFV